MSTRDKVSNTDWVLEDDILNLLAQAQNPVTLSPERILRMRTRIMSKVAKDTALTQRNFSTIRQDEGVWIEIASGIEKKVLYTDVAEGIQSYLLRLHPGAALPSHEHHKDEECVVLEGSLTMDAVTLSAGDYHLAPKGLTHACTFTKSGALVFIRGAMMEYQPNENDRK